MVEIRRLKPTVQMRKLQPVEIREVRSPKTNGGTMQRKMFVEVRRRKDWPAPTPLDTPCVIWQGSISPDGYGRRKMKVGPGAGPNEGWKTVAMHRWVIETVERRKLRPDQVVMHLCDNRICYRYDHLKVGTTQANTADMVAKKRNKKPPVHHYHGAANPNARLTEAHIARVKQLSAEGYYQKTIASMTGISKSHVQRILAGQTWWHEHYKGEVPDEFRIERERQQARRAAESRREPGTERAADGPGPGPGPELEADPHGG